MVVFGLLTTILVDSFSSIYKMSYHNKNLSKVSIELNNASLQIQKLLQNSIKDTIKIDNNQISFLQLDKENFYGLYDGSKNVPNYSQIVDTNLSSNKDIFSPNSKFKNLDTILKALFNQTISSGVEVLYFVEQKRYYVIDKIVDNEHLILKEAPTTISKNYYLSYGASAIKQEKNSLYLYRHYLPWQNQSLIDATKVLLLQNVAKFEVTKEDNLINITICSNKIKGYCRCISEAL